MKVLVTTSTFPRWPNDPGPSFVFDLCRQLVRCGLDITVLAPHAKDAKKFEVIDGVKVYRYQYLPFGLEGLSYEGGILAKLRKNKWNAWQVPFFLLAQLCSLREIVRKEKINVIHAHWVIPQGLVAVFYKKFFNRGIKVVCTSHGSDMLALKGFGFGWIKKFVIRQADKLTAVSNALKREVEQLDAHVLVEVLPMGVDLTLFAPERYSGEVKRKYAIDGPFLLFVGRLSEEKGVEYLLSAMPEILKSVPSAKLVIVGSGVLEEYLRKMCVDLNIQERVVFVGAMAHEALPPYYATADILVGPSVREGFGLVFAEAMACGCAVVASDLPGIADIIVDGKTGFCVRPRDSQAIAGKTIEVLQDRFLREQVKSQARAYVAARFNAQRATARYREIISMNASPAGIAPPGFLKNISFRFIQPQTFFRAPYSFKTPPDNVFIKALVRLEAFIEIINTKIPGLDPSRRHAVESLCTIPKMSTYAIGNAINAITSQLRTGQAFVNVGVWHGFTFLAGLTANPDKRCVGIDNFSEFGGPKESFLRVFHKYKSPSHEFYEMDYQRYFSEKHSGPIGFYIYDGNHSYENQLKGLEVAAPFFAEGCIVLVDDTNIEAVHRAAMDFITSRAGQYAVLLDQKTRCNAHPTFWNGIIVFQKIA